MEKIKKEPTPLELPSENLEMERYINENKERLSLHIVDCIDYAIEYSETSIEVFKFKSTEFYVILYEEHYIVNLEHIFSYFLENEMYENCQKVKNVKDKILNFVKNVKTDYKQ